MTRTEVRGWLREQMKWADEMYMARGPDAQGHSASESTYYEGMYDAYQKVAKKLEV